MPVKNNISESNKYNVDAYVDRPDDNILGNEPLQLNLISQKLQKDVNMDTNSTLESP